MTEIKSNRMPINARDPDDVFAMEARLIGEYSRAIEASVADILQRYEHNRHLQQAAAEGYVRRIGENIPDATIQAAVKRLTAGKFAHHGVIVQHASST